ncbi:unnamed protein product [Lampetra fluviatilis]
MRVERCPAAGKGPAAAAAVTPRPPAKPSSERGPQSGAAHETRCVWTQVKTFVFIRPHRDVVVVSGTVVTH